MITQLFILCVNYVQELYHQTYTPVLEYAEEYGEQYPSITTMTGQWDPVIKAKVLQYLFSSRFVGAIAAQMPGMNSIFTGERIPAGNKYLIDDQGATWSDELAFYVYYNNVLLPNWFVDRAVEAVDSGLIGSDTWWKGKYHFNAS